MSTVTIKGLKNSQFTYPAGNKTVIKGNFTTSAAGVAANSDLATAVQVNDVVRIALLRPRLPTSVSCTPMVSIRLPCRKTVPISSRRWPPRQPAALVRQWPRLRFVCRRTHSLC